MDVTGVSWRKSGYSGDNGGACIEVGTTGPAVAIRDSKDQSWSPAGLRRQHLEDLHRPAEGATAYAGYRWGGRTARMVVPSPSGWA